MKFWPIVCNFCDVQECLESSRDEWTMKLNECTQNYEEHIVTLNTDHACQTEVGFAGNCLKAYSCSGAEACFSKPVSFYLELSWTSVELAWNNNYGRPA